MKVVACMPTRGLGYTRAIQALDRELRTVGTMGLDWDREYTWDKEIPKAQNEVTELALRHSPEYLLYVEEDVEMPVGSLRRMLEAGGIVTLRYKLRGGCWNVVTAKDGQLLHAGMGCLLVPAGLFMLIDRPYFDADTIYGIEDDRLVFKRREKRQYGGQDVDFWYKIQQAGLVGKVLDIRCDHLRLKSAGKRNHNDGCHVIEAVP